MEILETIEKFGTQSQCVAFLEEKRWGDTPICPYCNSKKTTNRKDVLRHKCQDCNRSFSVLIGTIMEATKLQLPKWFAAMCLILNAKKGISSLQLARDIGVNKNTAWFLQKRMRQAMNEDDSILKGIIETDETYIGGSLTHKHLGDKKKKQYHRSGMEHKTPVLGMLQRKGKIVVKVLDKAWGEEIKPIMKKVIDKDSELVTDGFGAYKDLGEYFNKHVILNHRKQIRRIGCFHTNSIEGFWSILKRAIIGQYHKINPEHLQQYLNEIAFKYNHRNNECVFEVLINNCLNTKMPLTRK